MQAHQNTRRDLLTIFKRTHTPPSPFLFSTCLLSHNPSGGLHGLNMLTGKLNRYILYKSPQTQNPQVAAFLNPELSSYCTKTIYALNTDLLE